MLSWQVELRAGAEAASGQSSLRQGRSQPFRTDGRFAVRASGAGYPDDCRPPDAQLPGRPGAQGHQSTRQAVRVPGGRRSKSRSRCRTGRTKGLRRTIDVLGWHLATVFAERHAAGDPRDSTWPGEVHLATPVQAHGDARSRLFIVLEGQQKKPSTCGVAVDPAGRRVTVGPHAVLELCHLM